MLEHICCLERGEKQIWNDPDPDAWKGLKQIDIDPGKRTPKFRQVLRDRKSYSKEKMAVQRNSRDNSDSGILAAELAPSRHPHVLGVLSPLAGLLSCCRFAGFLPQEKLDGIAELKELYIAVRYFCSCVVALRTSQPEVGKLVVSGKGTFLKYSNITKI